MIENETLITTLRQLGDDPALARMEQRVWNRLKRRPSVHAVRWTIAFAGASLAALFFVLNRPAPRRQTGSVPEHGAENVLALYEGMFESSLSDYELVEELEAPENDAFNYRERPIQPFAQDVVYHPYEGANLGIDRVSYKP